jgi:ATP-dependent helicase/nuclease subunit A
MELARDEVRVMTVHGAKGLEAPIVILADTTSPPQGWHPPKLLKLPAQSGVPDAPGPSIWATAKINDVGPMADAREGALDSTRQEYRRLLYVAMTRAIDRLIVCGIDSIRKLPDGCWYELVRNGLEAECTKEKADFGDVDVWRYRKTAGAAATVAEQKTAGPSSVAIPSWLTRSVETGLVRPPTLKPSGFVDDPVIPAPITRDEARERAIARGLAVHRLLQSLPDIPLERRADAAQRFFARREMFGDAERDTLIKQVLAILSEPRFAPLFGPGSRAEVSIAGRFKGRPVAGQVDRLVVTSDAVLIADYKSNRPAPTSLDQCLERYGSYVKQLALYRDVLRRVYPGRPVRAALLWTETLELMELPANSLDEALDTAVTSP